MTPHMPDVPPIQIPMSPSSGPHHPSQIPYQTSPQQYGLHASSPYMGTPHQGPHMQGGQYGGTSPHMGMGSQQYAVEIRHLEVSLNTP